MKTDRKGLQTPDTYGTSRSRIYTPQAVQSQLQLKINTFINFDAHSFLINKKVASFKKKQQPTNNTHQDIMKALLKFAEDAKKKQRLFKNKRENQAQKSAGMMQNYRQRFKKISNPLQIIQFYTRHHKFEPKQQHKMIIDKLLQISALIQSMENFDLDKVLSKVYYLINMIVDLNQQRLLIVIVVMAADICMESKQFRKAIFLYNQARLGSLYSGFEQIQIETLTGLGKISSQLGIPNTSIIFFKKALAYAWKLTDLQHQIQLYDLLGQSYCQQGNMDKAKYYHERFSKGQTEKSTSAIRKIYLDIIGDDVKGKNLQLYSENIDLLFLQTLTLPISNCKTIPPLKDNFIFNNYINGESPRNKISSNKFNTKCNQDPYLQIQNIISLVQFKKQMPNPDIQTNYVPINRYGKHRRDVQFSNTLKFYQILGTKIPVSDTKINKKYSIQKQIQLIMKQKQDSNWYQKIKYNVKQQRLLKVGQMRQPIQKSHLKTYKRKRSLSNQSQNIRNSVNKAILNWIDPQQ